MAEQTIIRSEIITVDKVSKDSYNNLIFTDKAGEQHKISEKRIPFFEKVIVPDIAVQLNYAMSSFGKEYIYNAVQVKDGLLAPVKPPVKVEEKIEKASRSSYKADPAKTASIERQVALKCACEIQVALMGQDPKYKPSGFWTNPELMYAWVKEEIEIESELNPTQQGEETPESKLQRELQELAVESELIDLSWEAIKADISHLYNEKREGWDTKAAIIKKLTDLGATAKDKIKSAYESLTDDNKLKFLYLVKEASKP